jgi:hypothetical protein
VDKFKIATNPPSSLYVKAAVSVNNYSSSAPNYSSIFGVLKRKQKSSSSKETISVPATPVIGIRLVSSYNHNSNTCCLDSHFVLLFDNWRNMLTQTLVNAVVSTSLQFRYSLITVLLPTNRLPVYTNNTHKFDVLLTVYYYLSQ